MGQSASTTSTMSTPSTPSTLSTPSVTSITVSTPASLVNDNLHIKFVEPSQTIPNQENKSKLVAPECSLYKWVNEIRALLTKHQIVYNSRDPMYIEIVREEESRTIEDATKLARAKKLHDTSVEKQVYIHPNNKSLVVRTGKVDGYGYTHVFVAWFEEKINHSQLELLRKLIFGQPYDAKELDDFKLHQTNKIVFTHKPSKPKDWMCKTCNFLIHGRKDKCLKCGERRPC
jgi:hypothetical protein